MATRRNMLAALPLPVLPLIGASSTNSADALLLDLAAQQRQAEREWSVALAAADNLNPTEAQEAAVEAASAHIWTLAQQMAETPADTLVGVAAKAARVAEMLATDTHGAGMPFAYAQVAESMGSDLARLLPQAVTA